MLTKVRITRRGLGAIILAIGAGLLMTAVLPREVSSDLFAARDPGVRTGPAGAGGMYTYGLTDIEQQMFGLGQDQFKEVQSVQGTIPDTELGLGPRFNMDSCAGCHARSEEHTSELQSLAYLVCRLLLEKKKNRMMKCTRTHLIYSWPML